MSNEHDKWGESGVMSMPQCSLSLEGRVAIVTGSRRGIGRVVALRFAEAGANVAVCDIMAGNELDATAERVRELGRRSLAIRVDVRDEASVNDLVQKVEHELGGIDILANVAGIAGACPMVKLREREWARILDTNLKGCFLCCKAVAKGMMKRKKGNIINISSVNAYDAVPYMVAYACSKVGMRMLTSVLAFELGKYNIRVNAIAPGWILTKMIEPYNTATAIKATALGRLGEPSEIANVALFLASDLSSYVSGVTWRVDGGFSTLSLSNRAEVV